MKTQPDRRCRKNERGAALIMTLMISAMVLTAGGILLLTSSMVGAGTVDSAAEMQAYYGAEAGLQASLNVIHGNVMPNPLFKANPNGGVDPANVMTIGKAVDRATSNLTTDPIAGFPARLSRWLTYNYTPAGGAYADRVAITSNYNPLSGIAYSIVVTDPDNTVAPAKIGRVLIESTGYGPKGARKKLAVLLSSYGLKIDAPAPLVIRGHDNHSTVVDLDLGNSNAKTYSGVDNAGIEPTKPSIAVSAHDVPTLQAAYAKKPGTVADPKFMVLDLPNEPAPPGLGVPVPWFMRTANDARAFLAQAEASARRNGVVVSSLNGYAGSDTTPQFTFVKGDCELDGGSGLLIVTGKLTMKGNTSFNGVILVLGEGAVDKSGGGNGDTLGAVMVARFGATGDFLEPSFKVKGGGNSNLQYDSRNLDMSQTLTGRPVLGVVER